MLLEDLIVRRVVVSNSSLCFMRLYCGHDGQRNVKIAPDFLLDVKARFSVNVASILRFPIGLPDVALLALRLRKGRVLAHLLQFLRNTDCTR